MWIVLKFMVERGNRFIKHEFKEITIYIIIGITATILLPIFLGFFLKGFEGSFVSGRPLQFGDFLVSYLVYYIMILAGLVGLPILKIREMIVTNKNEHPANQSKPDMFSVAYLHDPEQDGLLYNVFHGAGLKNKENPMRWSLSIFRTFIIAIIIFGAFGLIQTIAQIAFVGVPQLPFQVSKVTEVLFTVEPPAFAETTLMIFVFSLLMGFNAWFTSKLKLRKVGYFSIGIFICLLIGFLWMGFHNIIYGNDEAKLFATFIFGAVGSFLTLLSGTFIFWYVWHFMNNLFVKLSQVATSNEDVIFVSSVILIMLIFTYITGEIIYQRMKKRFRDRYEPQTPE